MRRRDTIGTMIAASRGGYCMFFSEYNTKSWLACSFSTLTASSRKARWWADITPMASRSAGPIFLTVSRSSYPFSMKPLGLRMNILQKIRLFEQKILIYKAECLCACVTVSHKIWQTDTKRREALEQIGAKRSDVLVDDFFQLFSPYAQKV